MFFLNFKILSFNLKNNTFVIARHFASDSIVCKKIFKKHFFILAKINLTEIISLQIVFNGESNKLLICLLVACLYF